MLKTNFKFMQITVSLCCKKKRRDKEVSEN